MEQLATKLVTLQQLYIAVHSVVVELTNHALKAQAAVESVALQQVILVAMVLCLDVNLSLIFFLCFASC